MLPSGFNRYLEPLFAAATVVLVVYAAVHLVNWGYLPQPFSFNPQDFQMDWYNTSYFAHHGVDAYDYWGSVYPPLTALFLRVVSLDRCYEFSDDTPAVLARQCDWVGMAAIEVLMLVNLVLVWRVFRRRDAATAPYRTLVMIFGTAMAYAWERGNVVLVTFTCFVLAFGQIVYSARARWAWAALAINFKPYLVVSALAFLGRRQGFRLLALLAVTAMVYAVTWVLYGSGSPGQVLENIATFSHSFVATGFLDIWFPSSLNPLLEVLQSWLPLEFILGSDLTEWGGRLVPLWMALTQLLIVGALIAAFFRPKDVETSRLVLLTVGMALVANEVGGYTHIFIVFGVFLERWETIWQKAAIVLTYLVSLPGDLKIGENLGIMPHYSYFADRVVQINVVVTVGPIVRPILMALVMMLIAVDTILRCARAAQRDNRARRAHEPLPAATVDAADA